MSPTIHFVQPHMPYKLLRLILWTTKGRSEHYCLAEPISSSVPLIQSCCCADPHAKREVIYEFTHLEKSKASYIPRCTLFALLPAVLYGVSHRVGSSVLRQFLAMHYCSCDDLTLSLRF